MSLNLSYYMMFFLIAYCGISSYVTAFFINISLENPIRRFFMRNSEKVERQTMVDDQIMEV
jgi:hypothetical protein